jgi:hypothetical protein
MVREVLFGRCCLDWVLKGEKESAGKSQGL